LIVESWAAALKEFPEFMFCINFWGVINKGGRARYAAAVEPIA
jgi:hypothetical protein